MDTRASWPELEAVPNPSAFKQEDALQHGGPYSGVYILLDLAGGYVYVGQSIDIANRIKQHRLGTPGRPAKSFHRAIWVEIDDDSDRLRYEGILIIALAPRLNREVRLGRADGGYWYVPGRRTYRRSTAKRAGASKVDPAPRKGLAKGHAGRRKGSAGAHPHDQRDQGS